MGNLGIIRQQPAICSSVQKRLYPLSRSDIRKRVEKSKYFISANFKNFQQVAPLPMYQAKENSFISLFLPIYAFITTHNSDMLSTVPTFLFLIIWE